MHPKELPDHLKAAIQDARMSTEHNHLNNLLNKHPHGIQLPPVHPGRTLAGELAARGLTASALALKLRVPSNRLSEIIRGERAISAETAMRLGRSFGNGAQFWVNLQVQYDLALAEREHGARIDREVGVA